MRLESSRLQFISAIGRTARPSGPERPFGRRPSDLCAAALAVALLAGCGAHLLHRHPHLGELYDRSAQAHGPEQNPVIVIPGLTGSRLRDAASGRIVWGAFSGNYAKPNRPDGARLIALPMRPGAPLAELRDGVEPNGVLDRVRVSFAGLPLDLKAYFQILAALGAGGYRDEGLAEADEIDWGDDHFTCFQFDYDWRRDNVENARRLHEYIQEKRAYVRQETLRRYGVDPVDLKFDVVAHSMGGLLLRYYLRYGAAELPAEGPLPEVTWAGAAHVERAVLVAPPNAGSLEALTQLVEGRDYGPFLARYPPALLGTFPSAYQMLPRARHQPLTWSGGGAATADLFDPELWERLEWGLASPSQEKVLAWLLPEVADAAERREIARDHLRKSLARARRFVEALDRPAPAPQGLQLFLLAGDSVPTARAVEVDPTSGRLRVVVEAPGDGSVLRSSALMDERESGDWTPRLDSPVVWDEVMFLFRGHLGLTKDPVFTDNLLYWLLEDPRGAGH